MLSEHIGEEFSLDLARIFEEGFSEELKGTPEFGEMDFSYGTICWIGDGEYPGDGTYNGYDWKIAPFERITTDDGILHLVAVDADDDEGWIEGEVIGTYGLPYVRLSEDEFEWYAEIES